MMGRTHLLASLCTLACLSRGVVEAADATCRAGGAACVEEEGASALQVRREVASVEESVGSSSGSIITGIMVLGIVEAAIEAEAIARMQEAAYDWLTGSQTFAHAVGPFGMPLSIGVINDLSEPVNYTSFTLLHGHAFGTPKLGGVIKPGEMMQWFLFTQGVNIKLTMTFESSERSWSVAAAQYRTGNWFKHCDRLRMHVVPGLNTSAALKHLCFENGGPGSAGIQGNGSYKLTMLLNESLQHSPTHEDEAEESLSALQVVEGTNSGDHISADARALTTTGFFITPAVILTYAVKTVTAAIIARMVGAAFQYLSGHDSFQRAVGLTGLPLTVGVINDTPYPVLYKEFHLRDGSAWGYPGLKTHIAPGEMFQWFLFTPTTGVEATMMFEKQDGSYLSMAVAQYRYGNLFEDCDRMRVKLVEGSDLSATLKGLCKANGGGDGAGIRVQGGYKLTVLLGEVLKSEPVGSADLPVAVEAEAKAVVRMPSRVDIEASVKPLAGEVAEVTQAGERSWIPVDQDTAIVALKFIAGTIARAGIQEAMTYLRGPDNFQHAVTSIGLPLTVGIINDTPEPVQFVGFELKAGALWGHPALLKTMAPGEMMQWYFYTHTMNVEAALQFRSGDRTWSIGVAQERLGNWFTNCDRMRCKVVPSANMEEALAGMCRTSDGAGIRVQGGYRMAVLLNEATEVESVASPAPIAQQGGESPVEASIIDHDTLIVALKFIGGQIAQAGFSEAMKYLQGPPGFQHTVSPIGLPLTVGVINDTPEPVQFVSFQLADGSLWGHPALMKTMQPGEMMQWFFYTHTMNIEAAIQLKSGDRTWSVGVAQMRMGNWFSGCDRLRCNIAPSENLTEAMDGMCRTSDQAGIRVQGGYKMAVLLNEAAQGFQESRTAVPVVTQRAPIIEEDIKDPKTGDIIDRDSVIVAIKFIAGQVGKAAFSEIMNYLQGSPNFQHTVTPIGLPLTVGVINDTPEPVQFVGFRLREGELYSHPALMKTMQPGEMMQWFFYTHVLHIEAALQFRSGDRTWSMGVAQERLGNWFSGCDRMRANILPSVDMEDALVGMCRTSESPGIRVEGGYKMAVLLNEAAQGFGDSRGAGVVAPPVHTAKDAEAIQAVERQAQMVERRAWLPVMDHDTAIVALKFVAGQIAQAGIQEALNYLRGADTFQHAVTPIGLPLTLGIINDTPEPVQFVGFQLRQGAVWGHPALLKTMQPGDMMSWYFYTHAMSVEAALQFRSGERTWSIGVAQERLGNWFSNCDRLRCKVLGSSDMDAAVAGMCRTSDGAGIRVQGGYRMAVLLNEATEPLDASRSPAVVQHNIPATVAEEEGLGKKPKITDTATIIIGQITSITVSVVAAAFDYFTDRSEFATEVGLTGLPLTIGVINDTPEPVKYVDFRLGNGHVFAFPALEASLEPGKMMQWLLYTPGSAVEASMLFEGSNQSWSIAVAQYRVANLFSLCNGLRCNPIAGGNMSAAVEGLCRTQGGADPEAVKVQSGYKLLVFLSKVRAVEEMQLKGVGVLSGHSF